MKRLAEFGDWLTRRNLVGVYLPDEDKVVIFVPDYEAAKRLADDAGAELAEAHNIIATVGQREGWGWVVVIAEALDVSLSRPESGPVSARRRKAPSTRVRGGLPHEPIPALIDGLDVQLSLWIAESMMAA